MTNYFNEEKMTATLTSFVQEELSKHRLNNVDADTFVQKIVSMTNKIFDLVPETDRIGYFSQLNLAAAVQNLTKEKPSHDEIFSAVTSIIDIASRYTFQTAKMKGLDTLTLIMDSAELKFFELEQLNENNKKNLLEELQSYLKNIEHLLLQSISNSTQNLPLEQPVKLTTTDEIPDWWGNHQEKPNTVLEQQVELTTTDEIPGWWRNHQEKPNTVLEQQVELTILEKNINKIFNEYPGYDRNQARELEKLVADMAKNSCEFIRSFTTNELNTSSHEVQSLSDKILIDIVNLTNDENLTPIECLKAAHQLILTAGKFNAGLKDSPVSTENYQRFIELGDILPKRIEFNPFNTITLFVDFVESSQLVCEDMNNVDAQRGREYYRTIELDRLNNLQQPEAPVAQPTPGALTRLFNWTFGGRPGV